MSDERGRGAADDGRPRDGDEPAEPEFGSSEWLLQQLTGGRRVERPEPATERMDAVAADDPDVSGAPAAEPEGAASRAAEPERSESPAGAPWSPGEASSEDLSRPGEGETARLPVVEPSHPAAPEAFDDLLATEEPEAADTAEVAEPAEEYPIAFSWNLTPGGGSDPLVAPDAEPAAAAAPPQAPPAAPVPAPQASAGETVPAPQASAAEPVPAAAREEFPAYRTPLAEPPAQVPTDGAAAPSAEQVEEAREPVPPVAASPDQPFSPAGADGQGTESAVDEVPPVAARSWVIEPREPSPPAEPEPPRTIFDPPPARDDDSESHGLAALLGFGEPQADAPSGRSIIGDTTSIIPIDPAALRPPTGTAGTGATDAPARSASPLEPSEPAAPVLPPIDAAALLESAPEVSPRRAARAAQEAEAAPEPERDAAVDAPTQQLDAAAMAALLRSERDEPAIVLPSEPAVPAAEAELALGGVPSPATSPIDAASLAAASAPAEPPAAPDAAEESDEDETDEETDGIAALFGDVAVVEPDAAEEPDAAPATQPEPVAEAAAEPEPEPEPDPAPELEGPQLPATVAFSAPPSGETPATDPYAQDAPPRFTPLATSAVAAAAVPAAAAPAAASGAVPPTTSTGAATGAPTSAGTPTGTSPTPPGGGLWASPNNRILLLVLSALAVVLVLIGLFALGTRIPSLFGAPEPAPKTTASQPAASASPSPTPTPAPTVTPKPAAAVGPGTHPWYALGGGECIQPFTSVWAQEFTVVDCASPHTAQLLYTNVLSPDIAAPYPGADALAQQIPGLCTANGVVDLNAAGAYPDLQVSGSFPATEEQWKSGQRSYYCFANRAGGEPLTSSVAGPGPSA